MKILTRSRQDARIARMLLGRLCAFARGRAPCAFCGSICLGNPPRTSRDYLELILQILSKFTVLVECICFVNQITLVSRKALPNLR